MMVIRAVAQELFIGSYCSGQFQKTVRAYNALHALSCDFSVSPSPKNWVSLEKDNFSFKSTKSELESGRKGGHQELGSWDVQDN